jgi:hypothetical protein
VVHPFIHGSRKIKQIYFVRARRRVRKDGTLKAYSKRAVLMFASYNEARAS